MLNRGPVGFLPAGSGRNLGVVRVRDRALGLLVVERGEVRKNLL